MRLSEIKNDSNKRLLLLQAADGHPHEPGWVWLLGVGSLVVMTMGVLARNPTVAGSGALLAALLVLLRLVTDLRSGVTSSNWGTWRRDENRIGFISNTCFWALVTLALFGFGVATISGLVHLPTRDFIHN